MRGTLSRSPKLVSYVCLIAALAVAGVNASEYMPLEPGVHWSYTGECEAEIGPTESINGYDAVPLSFVWPVGSHDPPFGIRYLLQDDPSGPLLVDIEFWDGSYTGYDWIFESWFLGLEEPVPLFSLPFEPGSVWVDLVATSHGDVSFSRVVSEEVVVATPYGHVPAYSVRLTFIGSFYFSVEFCLNSVFGPVGYDEELLVELEGIVSTESTTWSSVKAVFE